MKSQKTNDILSTDTLNQALGALSERFFAYVYPSVDSTNANAKQLAASGVRYALVSAESQTAGRGRMGRSFYSPDGTGVYFSILSGYNSGIHRTCVVDLKVFNRS